MMNIAIADLLAPKAADPEGSVGVITETETVKGEASFTDIMAIAPDIAPDDLVIPQSRGSKEFTMPEGFVLAFQWGEVAELPRIDSPEGEAIQGALPVDTAVPQTIDPVLADAAVNPDVLVGTSTVKPEVPGQIPVADVAELVGVKVPDGQSEQPEKQAQNTPVPAVSTSVLSQGSSPIGVPVAPGLPTPDAALAAVVSGPRTKAMPDVVNTGGAGISKLPEAAVVLLDQNTLPRPQQDGLAKLVSQSVADQKPDVPGKGQVTGIDIRPDNRPVENPLNGKPPPNPLMVAATTIKTPVSPRPVIESTPLKAGEVPVFSPAAAGESAKVPADTQEDVKPATVQVPQTPASPLMATTAPASEFSNTSAGPEMAIGEVRTPEVSSARLDVAPPRPELARHVAQQLADVARHMPNRPVEINLNPEELGRVRLTFALADGGINVAVLVERGETMDLLRRHIDTLAQEFRDLGYRDVKFDFARNGQGDARNGQGDAHNQGESPESPNEAGNQISDPETPATARLSLAPATGLDLRL